jgi:hypothetical protein
MTKLQYNYDIIIEIDILAKMMVSQKPLKNAIGLISLAYNQSVIQLNVPKGGVFVTAS